MTSHGCLQMEKTKKESICVMRNITVSYVWHIYSAKRRQKGTREYGNNCIWCCQFNGVLPFHLENYCYVNKQVCLKNSIVSCGFLIKVQFKNVCKAQDWSLGSKLKMPTVPFRQRMSDIKECKKIFILMIKSFKAIPIRP